MRRTLALSALALLVGLATLELGMQAIAFVARARLAPTPDAIGARAAGDALRVLCVGDSHTWGLGVFPDQSYPSQLQAALSEHFPDRHIEVVNLGVPGINSAYVARRLEAQILALRPRLVLVWVGTNDMWNALEAIEDGSLASLHRLLLHSKLYRLASVLWSTRAGAFDVHQEDTKDPQYEQRRAAYLEWLGAGKIRSEERVERSLGRSMRRIVEIARALDTPLVFLTYPQQHQELPVSEVIERNARELGVPVVVTARDRERARQDGHRDLALFVNAAGPHPSPLLYRYVVESLLPPVTSALGLAEPPRPR